MQDVLITIHANIRDLEEKKALCRPLKNRIIFLGDYSVMSKCWQFYVLRLAIPELTRRQLGYENGQITLLNP